MCLLEASSLKKIKLRCSLKASLSFFCVKSQKGALLL